MTATDEITKLFLLRKEYGSKLAALIWAYQNDKVKLEEAKNKANKWPRKFWNWWHFVDYWERNFEHAERRMEEEIGLENKGEEIG